MSMSRHDMEMQSETQKPSNQVAIESNFSPSFTLLKIESKTTHC